MKRLIDYLKRKEILRFNILYLLIFWGIILNPFIISIFSVHVAICTNVVFLFIVNVLWSIIIFYSAIVTIKLIRNKRKEQNPVIGNNIRDILHVVVVCCYNEPLPLIERTLDSLCRQTVCKNLIILIGFEQKTKDVTDKIFELWKDKYQGVFHSMLFTIHPFGLKGEIAGKCSNLNWAARFIVNELQAEKTYDINKITITNCDADNIFAPRYFQLLAEKFVNSDNAFSKVWQAPLFYNWGLEKSPFFVRVISLMRTTFMMGAIIPWNLHSMSVQSVSLKLCIEGDYFNPYYHMDDVMSYVRWLKINKHIKVELLDVPTLCGPTSGKTYREELSEWFKQGKRWTVGIAETFHFFCTQIRDINLFKGVFWAVRYLGYYNFFLTAAPLLFLVAGIYLPLINGIDTNGKIFEFNENTVFLYGWLYQLFCIFLIFILNGIWIQILGIKEKISIFKNILHFFLAPLALIMYAFVQIYALHEMLLKGKAACGHVACRKDALAHRGDEN